MKKSLTSKPNKPFNIILLGDPASGKGTQGLRLAKIYGLHDLDMGKEVRKPAIRAQFDYEKTTGVGKLTPTTIARKIFKDVISGVPSHQGILFSGNPKMINEAKLVARLLKQYKRTNPLVIYLHLPIKETILRMEHRRESIEGKLVKRDDDTLRALKNRRKYYKEQISQVVIFFKKHYTLKTVSGMGSEKEVAIRIDAIIKKYNA